MNKYLRYAGWILSLILLVLLIVIAYGANITNTRLNARMRTQADNFTVNYDILTAQYEKLRSAYNDLVVQNVQQDAIAKANVAALNATIEQTNEQWKTTLNATLTARDAQWKATVEAALAENNAQWKVILDNVVAQLAPT